MQTHLYMHMLYTYIALHIYLKKKKELIILWSLYSVLCYIFYQPVGKEIYCIIEIPVCTQ